MSPPKRFHLFGTTACYLPFGISMAVGPESPEAWWISWLGSWFIFYMVWTGRVFELGADRKRSDQALRPWFIMHLVYAGYSFCTSIFYWMDLQGWFYLSPGHHSGAGTAALGLAARAQVMYVLAHAALVTGFGLARGPLPLPPWRWIARRSLPEILIKVSAGAFLLTLVFSYLPGLEQFAVKARALAIVGAGMSLGLAHQDKASQWFPLALGLNGLMLLSSLASGWKEATMVLVLLNALAFYPSARWRTVILTAVTFMAAFVILPSVSGTLRRETWSGDTSKSAALVLALQELTQKSSGELSDETWAFLTARLSEQSLFTSYLDATPNRVPYHGWEIAGQAGMSLVPRQLWPGKPNLEQLVMTRVYENGAVSELSSVSAKPQFIVDGYLSAGAWGVLLSGVVLGFLGQSCSRWCEEHFGGYLVGGVVFNGLFAIFWRANCWEFLLNPVVWSLVLAWMLHHIARNVPWIAPAEAETREPGQASRFA